MAITEQGFETKRKIDKLVQEINKINSILFLTKMLKRPNDKSKIEKLYIRVEEIDKELKSLNCGCYVYQKEDGRFAVKEPKELNFDL